MTIQKLENPDLYPGLSTENKLYIIQNTLLPFAAHPENFPFTTNQAGNKFLYYGGIGSIALSIDAGNTRVVTFESEQDFRVTAEFRTYSAAFVEPTALDRYGALVVQESLAENAQLYIPNLWKNGGYSLLGPEDNMPNDVIDQVVFCVEGLKAVRDQEHRGLSLV